MGTLTELEFETLLEHARCARRERRFFRRFHTLCACLTAGALLLLALTF